MLKALAFVLPGLEIDCVPVLVALGGEGEGEGVEVVEEFKIFGNNFFETTKRVLILELFDGRFEEV